MNAVVKKNLAPRVGVLTSGGDCPGLNPGIVGVTETLRAGGAEVVGIRRGYAGLLALGAREATDAHLVALDQLARARWMHEGGTLLGSSRTTLNGHPELLAGALAGVAAAGLDRLIVFGGDGSLRSAAALADAGCVTVGIPKTIDHDVHGTDEAIGYATAVEVGCEMVERIRTTARSHGHVFLVEVMGRRSGWLAADVALAAGADGLLVGEARVRFDTLAQWVTDLPAHRGAVVVMAEGCWFTDLDVPDEHRDAKGRLKLGRVGDVTAELLAARGLSVRSVRLGHTLRGGRPIAHDRLLAVRLGRVAAAGALDGEAGVAVVADGHATLRPFATVRAGKRLMGPSDLAVVDQLLIR